MTSELQRDFDALAPLAAREPYTWEAFVRIRARLTPDREVVARAMYDEDLLPGDVYMWDDTTIEDRSYWLAKADAAINAMGEP